ncbi:hypothetical protein [Allobaculum mucilyticum]|uniref:hypothetical protein n=1 Tax=Allobaculum mucilyticum TaxID=2834459 RepID=UPI001E42090E|nr:hypothetical protein [Allobaculum mucilyticum]UNT96500.1 hypothetical protein KWG62_01690 [Allobaculum mucilyticum]
MNRIDYLRNEAENLNMDARRKMAADLLGAEQRALLNSMVPLDADHRAVVEEERTDRILIAAGLLAASTALLVTTCVLVNKGRKKAAAKAEQAKAALEAEKKAMIRRMASIKGRA